MGEFGQGSSLANWGNSLKHKAFRIANYKNTLNLSQNINLLYITFSCILLERISRCFWGFFHFSEKFRAPPFYANSVAESFLG